MRNVGRPPSTDADVHAGWRSRGYLPHFDSPETVQHIVFRLADAIPAPVMDGPDQAPAAQVEGHNLSSVVQAWTSFTGNAAPERRGTFWAREHHDRFMRDERHLGATRSCIEGNPVKAGLCRTAGDRRFSSACAGRSTTG